MLKKIKNIDGESAGLATFIVALFSFFAYLANAAGMI